MALVFLQSKLPSELVREICSYDSTYHGYVKSNIFKVSLMKYVYNMSYKQIEWMNRIIETILYYGYNEGWAWYNEWGEFFANTGYTHVQHYWHFYDYERFRIIFDCGNSFMKFKIVPNISTISDKDYLEHSNGYDGIIVDFQLHHKLLNMPNERQRNCYLRLATEWEDGNPFSDTPIYNVHYFPTDKENYSHYIWFRDFSNE